jgi:hypothetical protein
MSDEKLVKDGSIGDGLVQVACAGPCFGMTKHKIVSSMDRVGYAHDVDWWSRYQILMCQGCETLSFRHVSGSSEDYEQVGENEWISHEQAQLYPSRKADLKGLTDDDIEKLPQTVALLYRETRTTLVNATPVLTGIGLRALVETVCKQKNSPGDNLLKQIDGLVTLGVLTKTDATVLHQIRTMGNDAAHEAKPHPDEQLALAMEVVEHLLKSVYVIPTKLIKFAETK